MNPGPLNYLIQRSMIDDHAAGVTRQVIAKGLNSLTEKQAYIFRTHVVDEWLIRKCPRCQAELSGDDLILAWENKGFCSYCVDKMSEMTEPDPRSSCAWARRASRRA